MASRGTRYTCIGDIRREEPALGILADFDLAARGGYSFPPCPGLPGQLVRAPESNNKDGVTARRERWPEEIGATTRDQPGARVHDAWRDREPDDTPDRGCRRDHLRHT